MTKKLIILFFMFLICMKSVYAESIICSGNDCKEKITIKNSSVSVFPDSNNESNSFITVYKDGEKSQYIAIKQNNITNCQKTPCDNIFISDNEKLYFEFNINNIKNKNNLRIKIDYFTVNERNNNVISVVDYNSLKFYVVENNKFYNIDDTVYKGLFRRTTSTSTYQDNFDIISENLFKDSSLNNYDSLTIRVYPFYSYYATTGAYFDFKSISIIDDNYTKEQKEINSNINLDKIRNNIINRSFYNATFKWTPTVSFTSNPSIQIDTFNQQRGSVFYTSEKISELGLNLQNYYGLPYGYNKIGSTEEFASRIVNGKYDTKDSDSIYSFSCTSAMGDAVFNNIPVKSALDWNAKLFYSNETRIVNCPERITYNNISITPVCSNIDKNNITSLSADEIRNEQIALSSNTFTIVQNNGDITTEQDMFSRYANLKIGDLLVHKEVCGDVASMYCSTSGHTRLVTEDPVVVLKYDNNSNSYVIDGKNSYVYVTETEHFITDVPVLDNIDLTPNNIKNYFNNIDITNYKNSSTDWLVSKKYNFDSLYYGFYERNSIGVGYNYNYIGYDHDADLKKEIYIPLTFIEYDNIEKNGGIEKPKAGLIYNDTRTYFSDNYYVIGSTKLLKDKLIEQIYSNDDIKLLGTISTNYKLTGVRFDISTHNKEKYTKVVYPVYGLNNLETRYSLYYEPETEEINEYLNNNRNDLKEIKITVLYAGPNTNTDNVIINNVSIPNKVTSSNEIVVFDMDLSFVLSFNTNGGNSLSPITVYNSQINNSNLPIPVKEGYTFNGWYLDESLKTKYTDDYNFTSNTTLYAGWTINRYTVRFDTNGGNSIDPIMFNYGTTIPNGAFPDNPKREGYIFTGWYIDKETTEPFYETALKDNITIYAGWRLTESTELTNGNINLLKSNQNTVTVSIDNIYTNQKYTLYKSTNKKKWTKVGVMSGNSYSTKINFGQKTYFRVTVELGKKKVNTNTVDIKVLPDPAGELRIVSAGAKNIKLDWDKSGYTGYELQRSTKATSGFKKVTFLTKNTKTSYNNTKLKNATTYYYRVRPYKTVSGKKVYGGFSNVVSATTGPATPKKPSIKTTNYNTITLNIKSTKTASYYEVLRSTNKKKGYTTLVSTTELSFTDTVDTGRVYYYKTRACNALGVCGGWTGYVSKKTSLSKPKLSAVSNEKVTLTITSVDGATGYVIQRSTKKSSGFKNITSSTDLSYEDNNVKVGKTYYYRVRAYRVISTKKVYGGYTKPIKVVVK